MNLRVDGNRLITQDNLLDQNRVGSQKEGIAVFKDRSITGWIQEKLGLAEKVTINNEVVYINKRSRNKFIVRTTNPLDANPIGRFSKVHRTIKDALEQTKVDTLTVLSNHVNFTKQNANKGANFSDLKAVKSLLEKEAQFMEEKENNIKKYRAKVKEKAERHKTFLAEREAKKTHNPFSNFNFNMTKYNDFMLERYKPKKDAAAVLAPPPVDSTELGKSVESGLIPIVFTEAIKEAAIDTKSKNLGDIGSLAQSLAQTQLKFTKINKDGKKEKAAEAANKVFTTLATTVVKKASAKVEAEALPPVGDKVENSIHVKTQKPKEEKVKEIQEPKEVKGTNAFIEEVLEVLEVLGVGMLCATAMAGAFATYVLIETSAQTPCFY